MAVTTYTPAADRVVLNTSTTLGSCGIPQRVYLMQYDDGLPIVACKLYKGCAAYAVPDGGSVRLRMNKGGLPVYHDALGVDAARTTAYFEVTTQMTVLYGDWAACIEVETAGGDIAGTGYLRLEVRKNPVQEPDLDNIPDYGANSNKLLAEDVKKLQAESDKQQAAITKKGQETLESIPEEYGTLSDDVDALKEDLHEKVGLDKVIYLHDVLTERNKEYLIDVSRYSEADIKICAAKKSAGDAYFTLNLYDDAGNFLNAETKLVTGVEKYALTWSGQRIKKYVIENPNSAVFDLQIYQVLADYILSSQLKKEGYILNGDYSSVAEIPQNRLSFFTANIDGLPSSHINIGAIFKGEFKDKYWNTHEKTILFDETNCGLYKSDTVGKWTHYGRSTLLVGKGRNIETFTKGLEVANELGNCDVYVDAGTYDIIQEIGEENLSTYIFAKTSGHGPYIGNGTRLFMSAGAKVICNYTGSDKTVHSDFSILNVSFDSYEGNKGDFEIYGGEFIGKNIRYIVHDEATGITQYRHRYYDCKMTLDNTNNPNWNAKQCIGGGLGKNGTIIIEGGIYNSIGIDEQADKGTITYHNPDKGTSTTFKNSVIIRNVYFETGTCYVSCLGDDTAEDATLFICNGCSMKQEPFANGLDNPYVNHNVTIRKWNNEIRLN